MLASRILSRASKHCAYAQFQSSSLISPILSLILVNGFHSSSRFPNKLFSTNNISQLQNATLNSIASQAGVAGISISSVPPNKLPNKKKSLPLVNYQDTREEKHDASKNAHEHAGRDAVQKKYLGSGKAKFKPTITRSVQKRNRRSRLSVDSLWKLLHEMEEHLKLKDKEIEQLKEKLLCSTTAMVDMTKLETEGSWKRAIAAVVYLYSAAHSLNIIFLIILLMGVLF